MADRRFEITLDFSKSFVERREKKQWIVSESMATRRGKRDTALAALTRSPFASSQRFWRAQSQGTHEARRSLRVQHPGEVPQ